MSLPPGVVPFCLIILITRRVDGKGVPVRRLLLHADDFGATPHGNGMILRGIDEGCLNSVSLMATGHAFDGAVEALAARPGVAVAAHLNLWEGRPVSSPEAVPDLVTTQGRFRHGFVSLWRACCGGDADRRDALLSQIRTEYAAQWNRIRRALPPGTPLALDSHVHFHLIPPLFRIASDLLAQDPYPDYIRHVREPWWVYSVSPGHVLSFCNANPVKHMLLRHLSGKAEAVSRAQGQVWPDVFLGVLYTGRMTAPVARGLLRKLAGTGFRFAQVLFHPGGASEGEEALWEGQVDALAPMRSPMRERELEAVLDPEVCRLARTCAGEVQDEA